MAPRQSSVAFARPASYHRRSHVDPNGDRDDRGAATDAGMSRIVALGAEAQAASSLALAYPDRDVLLVSDQSVLDGWDLANVRFLHATPQTWRSSVTEGDVVVPLSARWLPDQDWCLTRTLPIAAQAIGPEHVLPVGRLGTNGNWQVKGDRWHRPDAPIDGPAGELVDVTDPHGCGLVYQPQLRVSGTVMTIGRFDAERAAFGLFRVFEERFFRDVILQAAESIADSELADRSLAVIAALALDGFCTLNWVLTDEGPRLTSLRLAPRAVFGTLRRGGIDLLAPSSGTSILAPGLRLNAQPHYASYRRLDA
jgi:hypothetical protein